MPTINDMPAWIPHILEQAKQTLTEFDVQDMHRRLEHRIEAVSLPADAWRRIKIRGALLPITNMMKLYVWLPAEGYYHELGMVLKYASDPRDPYWRILNKHYWKVTKHELLDGVSSSVLCCLHSIHIAACVHNGEPLDTADMIGTLDDLFEREDHIGKNYREFSWFQDFLSQIDQELQFA